MAQNIKSDMFAQTSDHTESQQFDCWVKIDFSLLLGSGTSWKHSIVYCILLPMYTQKLQNTGDL